MLTLFLILGAGCARIPVQEISDARVLLNAAENSCATVYMDEEMNEAKTKLRLIDQGTEKGTRKSKRELKRLALDVQRLSKKMINETAHRKSEVYAQIQQETVQAIKKIHEAEKAEANRYARREYLLAIQDLREARKFSRDECKYNEAQKKISKAFNTAEQSIQTAGQKKKELEENLPRYHIVKRGETVKSIARDNPMYKDESYWEAIYKANRDQIRDPNALVPGQQLYLPSKKEIEKNKY